MDAVWILLGTAILVVSLLDTFLAVLNYDEPGIFVNRFVRWQWTVVRWFTRRVRPSWRPLVLRQFTGVLLLTTIVCWIGGIVLGFTLIYLGLIGLGAFQLSQGVSPDFVGAFYLSTGQFATVGADNISPAGGWVNLIPVTEALLSIMLLSFIITFLSNIYGVIQLLRSLCADFFQTGPGVGDPVAALAPYFPDGEPRDLDRHLNELVDDFNLYCDGLRQDHAAYHFQSGQDQFSLPFALYMTSGLIGALSWGLPSGHTASKAPSLLRLREAFDEFRDRRYRIMKWRRPLVPAAVDAGAFRDAHAGFRANGATEGVDPWAVRFLVLDRDMAAMTGAAPSPDADDAYRRYVDWLVFAAPAQDFVARVSRDLDFQPVYQGSAPAPVESGPSGSAAGRSAGGVTPRALSPLARLGRRIRLLDPGYVRFGVAFRTLGAAVVAMAAAGGAGALFGFDPVAAAVFAALVAVFSAASTSASSLSMVGRTGLFALLAVVLGIVAAAFLQRDPLVNAVLIAVVAALTIWLGRFGERWATYGHLVFLAYYFSLLLDIGRAGMIAAIIAAVIGVICGWLSSLLSLPGGRRRIESGVDAVIERVGVLIDVVIDAVSGSADPRLTRQLRGGSRALRKAVTALTGLLGSDAADSATPQDGSTLALQAFDVQLAAENLLAAIPSGSDAVVTLDERARLAGELATLRRRLDAHRGAVAAAVRDADAGTPGTQEPPAAWPRSARRAHAAIEQLAGAVGALTAQPISELSGSAHPRAGTARGQGARTAAEFPRAANRRAVQAGVATLAALYLGSLVSVTTQYWSAMPAYQAFHGSEGESVFRTIQRIFGMVVGAAVGFGIALWTGHAPVIAAAVIVVSVFFMSFLRPVASSWTALWLMMLLATMYDQLAHLDAEAVQLRVLETLIGAIVAAAVAALLLPTRTRSRMRRRMSGFVAASADVTHQALQRLADPAVRADDARSRALAESEVLMQRRLDVVLDYADELRRAPGALQREGIEAQVMSLSALAGYARQLAAQGTDGVARSADTALWREADAATVDNFTAAIAVLDDRLPSRIHDLGDLTSSTEPGGEASGDAAPPALSTVQRINETLIAYIAAVRPGAADVVSPTR